MRNYLAIDSGGTKVQAILYDEHLHPIQISRVGSMRDNTTCEDLIRQNMEQLRDELCLTPETVIECISGVGVSGDMVTFLQESCQVRSVDYLNEGIVALNAACIFGDGIQTLAGTGSNCTAKYGERFIFCGGYGAWISDAGSGYWIGREAINAGIADYEGYGERTILTDYVAEHFGRNRERYSEIVSSIYGNEQISPAAQIASCAQPVSKAAKEGDKVALSILAAAGKVLGDQTTALIRREQIPDEVPVTISGSVWRSHRILFDTYQECIRAQASARPIKLPVFEPIIGIMIKQYRDRTGNFTDADCALLKELYPQFVSQLPFG